jgi:two-component system, OmpR family, phosphate regulon response regulator OmpR
VPQPAGLAMKTETARIVVVDDEPELRALLQRYLTENGFSVRVAADGPGLDKLLLREPVDAIVLDLVMPGEDGLSICRRLRAKSETVPIIMLTARGDPIDRIIGIEMGADDYLAKPFNPRELLARLNAVLRRSEARSTGNGSNETITFGPFQLDLTAMALQKDGASVSLSAREFAVLSALARHLGKPLSRARIIDLAFGRDAEVTDRAVDVQVTRLRKAMGEDVDEPVWLKTIWGTGYILVAGPSE